MKSWMPTRNEVSVIVFAAAVLIRLGTAAVTLADTQMEVDHVRSAQIFLPYPTQKPG